MEPIILASTSPRRQEIMRMLNLPFSVMTPTYTEPKISGILPGDLAELHAMKKVESIIRMSVNISMPWILGADTLICCDNEILEKPANREDAKHMIQMFSGKTHQVITAISLFNAATQFISTKISTNLVNFMELDDLQIEKYLDLDEWHGVAGGYRIQGMASCFINRIEGTYSSIVGLPIHELYVILREQDYKFI